MQKSYGAGETSGGLFRLFRDCLALLERGDARGEPVRDHPVPLAVPRPRGLPARHRRAATGAARALGDRRAAYYSAAVERASLRRRAAAVRRCRFPPGALRYLGATPGAAARRAPSRSGLEPAGAARAAGRPSRAWCSRSSRASSPPCAGWGRAGEGFRRAASAAGRGRRPSTRRFSPRCAQLYPRLRWVAASGHARDPALLRRGARTSASTRSAACFDDPGAPARRRSPRGWEPSGSFPPRGSPRVLWVGLEQGRRRRCASYLEALRGEDRAARDSVAGRAGLHAARHGRAGGARRRWTAAGTRGSRCPPPISFSRSACSSSPILGRGGARVRPAEDGSPSREAA